LPKSLNRVKVNKKQLNPFFIRLKQTLKSTITLFKFIDNSQVKLEEFDKEFEEEEATKEQPVYAKGNKKALVKLLPKDPKLNIFKLNFKD
jgi:hypothetical protein